ncbi:hypothetical protein A3I47_00070 [Candidatus Kaiserbacteria bacterium RIFCSPLOWO2_02_FULL_59_19]|nr:MAG: hypothetical protein A3I47_00070 [Candidatus Kaiserbacteria bacterium RIFCSPLOWO2_02_FULL_59_19]
MFCSSKNDPDETRPNANVCPVCLAHPGVLPVVNREAVRHVLRVGVALGGALAGYTEFDRKNYFYPDLPKGYQISQYEYPLVSGGELSGVAVTRVHLEEDTASSVHDESTGATTIDFNRAGVPLMELVTEPVITSAKQAGDFARELQLLLRCLGASEANMEKGEMRVEANVSVAPAQGAPALSAPAQGPTFKGFPRSDLKAGASWAEADRSGALGIKVEIKNLNSFRAMERAVEHEIKRQSALLERGGTVLQETRGWDEAKHATFSQRVKEGSADYRYFPDPDIPALRLDEISEFDGQRLASELPELPWRRRKRYLDLGLKADDAGMFVRRPGFGALFDRATEGLPLGDERIGICANYLANNIAGIRDVGERDSEFSTEMPMNPAHLRILADMVAEGKVTREAAIADERGLIRAGESPELGAKVRAVLAENRKVVADYRSGKTSALQFLVGQAMKELRGSDPQNVRRAIEEALSKENRNSRT